jgi:hypothetical protein
MLSADHIAFNLSGSQREFLIEHCCAPVPVVRHSHINGTRSSLVNLGLIRFCNGTQNTELTDLGREVACILLGHYADALVKAEAFILKRAYGEAVIDAIAVGEVLRESLTHRH